MKVCKRKLAGTEDPPRHPEESTRDRPARRQRVDYSVGASWEEPSDIMPHFAVLVSSEYWGHSILVESVRRVHLVLLLLEGMSAVG